MSDDNAYVCLLYGRCWSFEKQGPVVVFPQVLITSSSTNQQLNYIQDLREMEFLLRLSIYLVGKLRVLFVWWGCASGWWWYFSRVF
jgi:hypothetical protein